MVAVALFFVLLFFFLLLGITYRNPKSLKYFISLTVLLPITSVLSLYHTKFQINVYYAFIVFPVFYSLIINVIVKSKINYNILVPTSILGIFIVIFIPFGFIFNTQDLSFINVLKDIKPIFFLIIGFFFLYGIKIKTIEWNGRFTRNLLKYNFFISLIYFFILSSTDLLNYLTDDPFYQESEIRYISMGTFFVVFYFIAKLSIGRSFGALELLYILTPIFLSGNRTFFLVLAAILVLNMVMSITDIKSFFKKIILSIVGAAIFILGLVNFNEALKERILSLFDVNLLIAQLSEHRFAPFFEKISTFEWYNYFLGKGLGETFFIPWFTYRKNLDNYNIYMDNIYFTLFVKYGIFFLVLLYVLIRFINSTPTNRKFKIFTITYFFIMGLTTAFMYQVSYLFILIILGVFSLKPKSV